MEFSLACVVFCLTTSCIFWKEAEAVQCYSCTGCNDPFKASEATVTTCPYACLKTKAEAGSEEIVIRGCWTVADNKCFNQKYQGVEANLCSCTTDKCNGAESHPVQKAMFIVMSAFVFILGKILF